MLLPLLLLLPLLCFKSWTNGGKCAKEGNGTKTGIRKGKAEKEERGRKSIEQRSKDKENKIRTKKRREKFERQRTLPIKPKGEKKRRDGRRGENKQSGGVPNKNSRADTNSWAKKKPHWIRLGDATSDKWASEGWPVRLCVCVTWAMCIDKR